MVSGKKLTCTLVAQNAPIWKLAEVAKKALLHEGVELELVSGGRARQFGGVASAEADFGVIQQHAISWAYRGIALHEGKPVPNLRAIAYVDSPAWLAFAVTAETHLAGIEQIKERKFPLRILTSHETYAGGITNINFVIDRVLDGYGFTIEDIKRWGGRHLTSVADRTRIRERDFDAMINQAYAGYGTVGKLWQEATILSNLRFLPIASHILDDLCEKYDLRRGLMPKLLMRGVDEDVPTFYFGGRVIYTSAQLDEELAYITAKSLDEHYEYFLEAYMPFCYNPFRACRDTGAPLHPGAERYYRSRGYLK
jgi:TRAP transporter TAXI family solute receptor